MDNESKTVLVTGATGNQGGATARHLLQSGWKVRALSRDASKPAALALAEAGAEIIQGNFDNIDSLEAAAEGVYGLFSVQTPSGFAGEVSHGKIVADLAKSAGVQHIVYSSVGGAERRTGVPHFESKWVIEEYVREIGLPATIIRPVYFMDNLNWQRAQIKEGTLTSMGLTVNRPLQMIAAHDIGGFAALAFNNPDDYMGQALEIAGDELSEQQMAEALSDVLDRKVALVQAEGPPAYDDMVTMVNWFNDSGYEADIPDLRRRLPGLMSFSTWLKITGWSN